MTPDEAKVLKPDRAIQRNEGDRIRQGKIISVGCVSMAIHWYKPTQYQRVEFKDADEIIVELNNA